MRDKKQFVVSVLPLIGGGLLLSACGAAVRSTAEPTLAPTTAPRRMGTDPGRVVSGFLTALQNDPSGKSSLTYLSQDLQANVQIAQIAKPTSWSWLKKGSW
jgi:hypothetical protein